MRASGLVDVLTHRRRADETDGADVGVHQQRIHCLFVSINNVQYTWRQPGFASKLGQAQSHRRVFFRWLQHEGVAAGDGDGEHPHRHHGGKVERCYATADTDGLTDRVHVNPAGDSLIELALEQLRDATGELDHFDAAGQ